MSDKEDHYYIEKVLAGESSAFAVLVDRHKNNVFNICVKITNSKEEAEEAAQDTFLKVFDKLKTFKQEAKFSTWLYRIAYNTSISKQRKNTWTKQKTDDYDINEHTESELIDALYEESIEERELKLRSAIGKLAPDEQLLLQLYYDKDMSTEEIATITELTKSNVKVKIHRARKQLFNLLQPIPPVKSTSYE